VVGGEPKHLSPGTRWGDKGGGKRRSRAGEKEGPIASSISERASAAAPEHSTEGFAKGEKGKGKAKFKPPSEKTRNVKVLSVKEGGGKKGDNHGETEKWVAGCTYLGKALKEREKGETKEQTRTPHDNTAAKVQDRRKKS